MEDDEKQKIRNALLVERGALGGLFYWCNNRGERVKHDYPSTHPDDAFDRGKLAAFE